MTPTHLPSSGPILELTCRCYSFVETKGRTLEAINEIFEAPYPKKKSIQKHIVVVTDRGIVDKGLEDSY